MSFSNPIGGDRSAHNTRSGECNCGHTHLIIQNTSIEAPKTTQVCNGSCGLHEFSDLTTALAGTLEQV